MEHALRILIVEDHLLISKQIELIVTEAGHLVVGQASEPGPAIALAQSTQPDVVFLDIALRDGSSGVDVADLIAAACRGHIVFTTANKRRLPEDFCGAIGVVEKPFTRAGFRSALRFIEARLREDESDIPRPDCLQLSPVYEARWSGGA